MKSKLRSDNTGFVRIGKSAIKLAKAYKKKTGVPVGIFFEQAAILKIALDNSEKTQSS